VESGLRFLGWDGVKLSNPVFYKCLLLTIA